MAYEIVIHDIADAKIAEVQSDNIVLNNGQDAVDLLGNCTYHDVRSAIIYEHHLPPAFYDLSTRLAGDILQKFSNYRFRLAVVGEFKKYKSDSLRRFINESNRTGEINFVGSPEEALEKLSR